MLLTMSTRLVCNNDTVIWERSTPDVDGGADLGIILSTLGVEVAVDDSDRNGANLADGVCDYRSGHNGGNEGDERKHDVTVRLR